MHTQDSSSFLSKNHTVKQVSPLSTHGRFNRLSYIAWYSFLNLMYFFAIVALSVFLGIFNLNTFHLNEHDLQFFMGFSGIAYFLMSCIYLYFNFIIVIRRLHDRNKSGWYCICLFIPVINFFFALYLIFARGDSGLNNFGFPRPSHFLEKMLAWLMILMTIFSIFATGSIVSYFMGTGDIESPNVIIQKGTEYF